VHSIPTRDSPPTTSSVSSPTDRRCPSVPGLLRLGSLDLARGSQWILSANSAEACKTPTPPSPEVASDPRKAPRPRHPASAVLRECDSPPQSAPPVEPVV